jgi:hypothetical protein
LVPLGRNPVDLNGVAQRANVALAERDRIAIGGLEVVVAKGGASADDGAWLLATRDASFGLPRLPLTIGGGDHDDLVVPGCPAAALHLHRVGNALFVEAEVDGATLAGAPLTAGVIEPIADGDVIVLGSLALTARRQTGNELATRAVVAYPDRIDVDMLPRGARVTLVFAGATRSLVISELRLELLSVLLAPPPPFVPGAFIPDQVVFERVWPRNDRADHGDLNALVHRLRRDLVKAGVDGPALILRQPGATRFAIGAATQIAMR